MERVPSELIIRGQRNPGIGDLLRMISRAVQGGRQLQQSFPHTREALLLRPDEDTADYQSLEQRVRRDYGNDRQFPLETVMIQSHNLKHGTAIEQATAHVGPYADELARSLHAQAIAIGTHIFFRDGAYKPETEEGRKTLAHELTHTAQYAEKRIWPEAAAKEGLEREAEAKEIQEEYDDDPLQEVEIYGQTFYLRPSEHAEVIRDAARMTERWFEERRVILDEEEYARLMVEYMELKKRMI